MWPRFSIAGIQDVATSPDSYFTDWLRYSEYAALSTANTRIIARPAVIRVRMLSLFMRCVP